jgi:hypothetical protein
MMKSTRRESGLQLEAGWTVRLTRWGILLSATLILASCEQPELVLRTEGAAGLQVITFYKKGFLWGEYRVHPCVRGVYLEGSVNQRLWQIRAAAEGPGRSSCRELDSLRLGDTPAGFIAEVPFDATHAPATADLTVSSEEGFGGLTVALR